MLTVLFPDNPQNYYVKMMDAIGETVLETQSNIIDVENIREGIYFLNIETERYTIVKKVVVTH